MHLVFSTAKNNLKRKLQSIFSLFGVLPSTTIEAKNSLQIVRNLQNLVNYMASRGYVRTIGDKFVPLLTEMEKTEWENCSEIPSDCRRKRKRNESMLNMTDKRNRYLALAEEVESRNITHISQIHDKFTIDELMTIIAKNGNIYKDVIKQSITYANRRKVLKERNTPYLELYEKNMEMCLCSEEQHEEGKKWLTQLIIENGINPALFVKSLIDILDKKHTKINAFILEGPTNTGKSLLCNLIIKPYTYGTASRRGDQTNFHMENLLHKSIAVMEEPRITGITVDDFKQLLGGEPFQVDVKYQEKDWLARTPTIITTNEDIGLRLSKLDKDALLSRVFSFRLTKQISSSTINGQITLPNFQICPHSWLLFLKENVS